MALLSDVNLAEMMARQAKFRTNHVGTKLNEAELKEFMELVETRKLNPSELIRELILRELRWEKEETDPDPFQAEIVGVRLLLVNFLRPLAIGQRMTPEVFDHLLDEIAKVKHEVAREMRRKLHGKS